MPWISKESPKLYWKIAKKIEKMTLLTVKNGIFKTIQKFSISYGARFSPPKYHISKWKTVTGNLKPKIYIKCYIRKKSKNAYKKRSGYRSLFSPRNMYLDWEGLIPLQIEHLRFFFKFHLYGSFRFIVNYMFPIA